MAEAALDLTNDDGAAPDAAPPPASGQDTAPPPSAGATPPLAKDDVAEDPNRQPVSSFPDDWREQLSGGDEKLLKELSRFTTPQMLVKSWKDTRTKISSGQYKTSLPEDATPEELAQWRQENGVPESWEQYDRDLGDGMVLGEEDAPIVDSFLQKMHEKNMPAGMAKDVLRWYYEFNDQQEQTLYQKDVEFKESSLEALRADWGPEFKMNLNAIRSVVPEKLSDVLFSARTEDGERLGDHPEVLKWLAQTARELNPTATLIPGGTGGNLTTIENELADIRKLIANPASAYWKDEKMQKRFQDLLAAREKLASR